jgi:very-short-patch-repair endonuclease
MKAIPDIIKNASRDLRKNMTNSEKLLWEKLRAKKFN